MNKKYINKLKDKKIGAWRDKSHMFFRSMSVITVRGGNEIITSRYYFNERGNGMNPVYCALWIDVPEIECHHHSSGDAPGCGYHKASAALMDAIINMNAQIDGMRPCDGVGEQAMREYLLAIAKKLTRKKCKVIESYA